MKNFSHKIDKSVPGLYSVTVELSIYLCKNPKGEPNCKIFEILFNNLYMGYIFYFYDLLVSLILEPELQHKDLLEVNFCPFLY